MKKSITKSVIAFLVFVFVFIYGLHFFSKLMIPKDEATAEIVSGLYQQKKDSIDVLVLGDSSTYRSVNPAILWEDNKMTSYVIGASSARIYSLYYLLEEALKTQRPKLVVLEANCLFNTRDYTLGNKRKIIDNMKLSMNKINMIQDNVLHLTKKEMLSTLFPISLYHNRYNELTKDDVMKTIYGNDSEFNGFIMNKKVKPAKSNPYYMENTSKNQLDEISKKYLAKIENLCKEKNIPMMYLKVPGIREWDKTKNELVSAYAQEKGIPYYDMNFKLKDPIDWSKDTIDKGIHLNADGASKVTHELSEYVREHYNIQTIKSDEVNSTFDTMLKNYYDKLYKE